LEPIIKKQNQVRRWLLDIIMKIPNHPILSYPLFSRRRNTCYETA
jgi:hypothetical protein